METNFPLSQRLQIISQLFLDQNQEILIEDWTGNYFMNLHMANLLLYLLPLTTALTLFKLKKQMIFLNLQAMFSLMILKPLLKKDYELATNCLLLFKEMKCRIEILSFCRSKDKNLNSKLSFLK